MNEKLTYSKVNLTELAEQGRLIGLDPHSEIARSIRQSIEGLQTLKVILQREEGLKTNTG